uniref:HD domain-containing protein n=1 Tax=Caenorhabditis japonica TaxID=281687 RepID=A0A8R1I3Y3_CAEJA
MNWPTHAPKHRINDNVYGVVKIPSPIDKIIDTEEFQRLRYLKQTGLVNLVYPNCEHSRFVHSVGTFSLAFTLVDRLRHSQPSLGITSADHMCTSIAALLHDVGHGPFSHLFDGEFAKKTGSHFKHEEMSVRIIDRIMRKPEVRKACEPVLGEDDEYELNIKFIKELIGARPFDFQDTEFFNTIDESARKEKIEKEWKTAVQGRGIDKSFLYDIVSNTDSGHDVDKMDYLLRDSKASGVAITFSEASLNRLFDHVRVVIDPNSGLRRIGYSKKCQCDIKSIGDSRQELHSKVYQHKAVRFIETLMVDALITAGELLEYQGTDGVIYPLSRVTEDVEAFLKATDYVELQIQNSTSSDERMIAAKMALLHIKRREIGCKLGSHEILPSKAIHRLANNEAGASEVVKQVRESMARDATIQGEEFDGKYLIMHSVLGRGLDERTHPIQRQVFYDGKPHESERVAMIGCYVDEDYIANNCPKMATKWEIFAMGDRSLPDEKKEAIRRALRAALESLHFLTPRKRSPQYIEEISPSNTSAKRALFVTNSS